MRRSRYPRSNGCGRSSRIPRNARAGGGRPRTVLATTSPEVSGREFRQVRHDVDDVQALLDDAAKQIVTIPALQRPRGNRR